MISQTLHLQFSDFEGHLLHAAHRHAVAAGGEQEELLLEGLRVGQQDGPVQCDGTAQRCGVQRYRPEVEDSLVSGPVAVVHNNLPGQISSKCHISQ